jgi:hypothetical protein
MASRSSANLINGRPKDLERTKLLAGLGWVSNLKQGMPRSSNTVCRPVMVSLVLIQT